MTHLVDQRWVATPSPAVMKVVLDRRDDEAFRERFEAKVDRRTADGDTCHIWLGALSSEGYGNVKVGRHVVRAHRVAFILAHGEIPEGLFLDHVWPVCRYRFCVRVDGHLEPVDNAENTRRGTGAGRLNQRAKRYQAIVARDDYEQWVQSVLADDADRNWAA